MIWLLGLVAIGALGLAGYELWKHWSAVTGFFSGMWDGLKRAWQNNTGYLRTLTELLFPIPTAIIGHWKPISAFFGSMWDGMAYDPDAELVYVGTGNAGPWPENLRKTVGKDALYACSILAINVNTGQLKWYFQNVPGDSWHARMSCESCSLVHARGVRAGTGSGQFVGRLSRCPRLASHDQRAFMRPRRSLTVRG